VVVVQVKRSVATLLKGAASFCVGADGKGAAWGVD